VRLILLHDALTVLRPTVVEEDMEAAVVGVIMVVEVEEEAVEVLLLQQLKLLLPLL